MSSKFYHNKKLLVVKKHIGFNALIAFESILVQVL